jgi:hypothetical protein
MAEEKVWFETRKPRWRWQWWGWQKVDKNLVDLEQVRIFIMIAAAPHVIHGAQFRIRKPGSLIGQRVA